MSIHSVSCKIWDEARPKNWIEIEIGVRDDKDPPEDKFWILNRASPVSFPLFPAKVGEQAQWYWSAIHSRSGLYAIGILYYPIKRMEILFDLENVVGNFYQLNCGQGLKGMGVYFPQTTKVKVEYEMSFLCV